MDDYIDAIFLIILLVIGALCISAWSNYKQEVEQEAVEACSLIENGTGIYDMEVISDDYYFIYYCKNYEPVNIRGTQVSNEVYDEKAKEFFAEI